jgi:hypothetical protein
MASELSPFGRLVSKHLREKRKARQDLANAVGITNKAYMTRCLRVKGGSDPMAYAPSPSHLVPWADLLGLEGEQRREFIAVGLLARCSDEAAKVLRRELGLGEPPEAT